MYETDILLPIIQKIETISGKPYSRNQDGMSHRVLADHVRTLAFGIADDVFPSNEGKATC